MTLSQRKQIFNLKTIEHHSNVIQNIGNFGIVYESIEWVSANAQTAFIYVHYI